MGHLDLARRLESWDANHAAEYVRARLLSDPQFPGDIRRIAGGMAIRSGPDSPINFVVRIGLGTAVSAADVQTIEEFFRPAAIPPLFKLSPWADRELWPILKSRGYGVAEFLNVWVLPLNDWVPAVCAGDDVVIHEVGHDAADIWTDTVSTRALTAGCPQHAIGRFSAASMIAPAPPRFWPPAKAARQRPARSRSAMAWACYLTRAPSHDIDRAVYRCDLSTSSSRIPRSGDAIWRWCKRPLGVRRNATSPVLASSWHTPSSLSSETRGNSGHELVNLAQPT